MHPAAESINCLNVLHPCCFTDVLDDLNDHDALYITEEDAYERCEALARCVRVSMPAAVAMLCTRPHGSCL